MPIEPPSAGEASAAAGSSGAHVASLSADRMLQRLAIVGIVVATVFGLRVHAVQQQSWGLLLYGAALAFVAYLGLRSRIPWVARHGARILAIGIFTSLWLIGLLVGAFVPAIHIWLGILPLASSVGATRRAAAVWTAASIVQIVSLHLWAGGRELQSPTLRVDAGEVVATAILFALLCGFGMAYRRSRDLAEQRVASSEARLATIVESGTDVQMILRPNGSPTWISSNFEEVSGIPAGELTRDRITEMLVEHQMERIGQLFRELRDGSRDSFQEEIEVVDAAGKERIGVITGYPLNDGSGQLLLRLTDITALRKAQSEAVRSQRAIVQAERLESVGVLAAGIAHDFNNLLTGVLGNVSIARSLCEQPSLQPHLAAAETACRESTRLANQLLVFVRGGTPKLVASDLEAVVQDAANFGLVGSNSTPAVVAERGLPSVAIDTGQMGQVFTNLFLNSAQAMEEGGLIHVHLDAVELDSDPELPPGRYVRTVVTDAGCGIPKDALERVFDPYFTTRGSGNGLGLASARYIVENHDGAIRIRSTVGRGTAVTVLLPISEAAAEPTTEPPQKPPATRFEGRALIMDDEPSVRFVLAEMLRRLGFEVVATAEGESALKAYREAGDATFDLIVLDLTVAGGLGGLETVRQLRGWGAELPILVSSGYSNDDVLANYRSYGFTATLPKPYKLEDLRSVLLPLIEHRLTPEDTTASV